MAKKKVTKKSSSKNKSPKVTSEPKYPYTPAPNDLRRLLELIPSKPKPSKLVTATANTWGIKNTGVSQSLKVLRELDIIDQSGTPTGYYSSYMKKDEGGVVLGKRIKDRYKDLFEHLTAPQNAGTDELENFFNIHSGGSEVTIGYQVKTFKVLSEFASFDENLFSEGEVGEKSEGQANKNIPKGNSSLHFDFHLHLPENKSSAEYEALIKAIYENIIKKLNE